MMKKALLTAGMAVLLGAVMNAQEKKGQFKIGAYASLPTGDLSKVSNFGLGVDFGYLWKVNKDLDFGVTAGYSRYFGKTISGNLIGYGSYSYTYSSVQTFSIAATGQYKFKNKMFVGGDLGVAAATSATTPDGKSTSDFGLLYQPKIGYTFKGKHDVYVSYKGITGGDNSALNSVNLGYAFKF